MEELLATTGHLNNEAIEKIKHGDYLDAVGNLTSALQIVKDLMGVVNWEDENEEMQVESSSNKDIIFCAPQESFDCRPSNDESCHEIAYEHEESVHQALHKDTNNPLTGYGRRRKIMDLTGPSQTFIYTTPLEIWSCALMGRELNPELLSELSVVLMFNLALSHHLRAISSVGSNSKSCESSNQIFKQAVSLYELAYEVQMQEDVELSVECTMAIVNNLGHIHRRLGNQEKSTKCFSHLLSTLLFVHSSTRDEAEDMQLSLASTEGFVQSVSHLILKKQVAAAA